MHASRSDGRGRHRHSPLTPAGSDKIVRQGDALVGERGSRSGTHGTAQCKGVRTRWAYAAPAGEHPQPTDVLIGLIIIFDHAMVVGISNIEVTLGWILTS